MRARILRSIIILTIVVGVFYAFSRQISTVYMLHEDNEKIKMRSEGLQSRSMELRRIIETVNKDKLYQEKLIREELGMIKESEKIYRFQE